MKNTFLILILISAISLSVYSQSNEDCLICHDDPGFTGKVKGKTVSLHLNTKIFSGSVHGELECVDCHSDYNAEDIPHTKEYTKVN